MRQCSVSDIRFTSVSSPGLTGRPCIHRTRIVHSGFPLIGQGLLDAPLSRSMTPL
jgi:hypothetical protein